MWSADKLGQRLLALLDWQTPQVLRIQFDQVERDQHRIVRCRWRRIRSNTASPHSLVTIASPSSIFWHKADIPGRSINVRFWG
jgi:hypothetical protein